MDTKAEGSEINEDQDLSSVFSVPDTFWEILEDKGDKAVDGVNVLARAVGPFFLADGSSENGRYYSRELWESVLKKNQKVLDDGMLGAVGHDQEINDKAVREGLLSHKVTKLWIDDNKKVKLGNGRVATVGMGELLVLNTDSGRNLNTCLRAGIKLATSSRARGRFKGKTELGENIVDKDHYQFSTFDVVTTPGISVSQLNVVENKNTENKNVGVSTNKLKEDETVDKDNVKDLAEALEKVTTEKVKVTSDLGEALEKVSALTAKVNDLENSLKEASAHGTVEEIGSIKEELSEYKEIGSCDSIKESYEKIEEMMEKFKEYGDLTQIEETYEKFEDLVEELESIGSITDIKRGIELLEQYSEYGSPSQVKEAHDSMSEFLDKVESDKAEAETSELAEKHGIKQTSALKTILETIGKEEADVLLSEIEEGKEVTSRYRVHSDDKNVSEDKDNKSVRNQSKLERLFS